MQQATLVIVTASVKKTMRALIIMCSGARTLKMLAIWMKVRALPCPSHHSNRSLRCM